MHLTVDEVIGRIDSWKNRRIRYETLGGGITNHNYTVYVDDIPHVVRIPGAGT